MKALKIAPSILAADFARLGEQVRAASDAGADYIHIDVMDGQFVPNITLGPVVVAAIRKYTTLPFDVHLMIRAPEHFLAPFADAGANLITVHAEECQQLHRVVAQIHALGVKPGVAINPHTPLVALEEILPYAAQVNVMTVNPGFGGQTFIESMLPKIARLRAMADAQNPELDIEVDGGVEIHTAPRCVQAGANILIAGTSVFGPGASIAEHLAALRRSIET
ncbi:MAG: Ribulose-phosphate 3-epimerase [Anaerolineae bacterium]|nr:Ribulose-phosphate 3-epimerase [Anaerolineae bacterium]